MRGKGKIRGYRYGIQGVFKFAHNAVPVPVGDDIKGAVFVHDLHRVRNHVAIRCLAYGGDELVKTFKSCKVTGRECFAKYRNLVAHQGLRVAAAKREQSLPIECEQRTVRLDMPRDMYGFLVAVVEGDFGGQGRIHARAPCCVKCACSVWNAATAPLQPAWLA